MFKTKIGKTTIANLELSTARNINIANPKKFSFILYFLFIPNNKKIDIDNKTKPG